jgi:3-methylfumaryl-CoA hydratase
MNTSEITNLKPGDALPGRAYAPDNVQNFMYSAALWNAHRIHFDMPYATEVEGYPGIVMSLRACSLTGSCGAFLSRP